MTGKRLRHPLPADGEIVSDLILQSDCGMLPALFGADVRSLLCRLQGARANPFSAESILVAEAESRGTEASVVGMLVGSLAEADRSAQLHTAILLFRWYGLEIVSRLPRLAKAGKALESLEPDDYYVSNIAVLPEWRGRGLGKEILLAAAEEARAAGARRIVLDVEGHNEAARAFYARLGFHRESEFRIELGRGIGFSFVRLALGL